MSEGEEYMKTPKALYVLIAIFCVFAIIAGIYAQFIEQGTGSSGVGNNGSTVVGGKDRETIKSEFNSLFTNTINLNGFVTSGISKLSSDQEIIYSLDRTENTDAYELDIHIPVVNIKSDVASKFNNITQMIFADKANEVLGKTDTTTKTLYNIDYTAYVNDEILSVVIKSTLKEGQNAQRVIIQTYNYNLTTGSEVTLNDLITKKALNKDEVNNRIMAVVQEADNESKLVASAGYNEVFSRDLSSDMYAVDNSGTFFLGNQEQLYIIYAYGNQNFTSEMDIVLFE